MSKRVTWPGVSLKRAKGRDYYYWNRSTPWVRLPDPLAEPDAFMRKLAHLKRVNLKRAEARAGTFADAARLYRKHPDFTDRAANTQSLYETYLGQLEDIFGAAPLSDITPVDVQRYVLDEHADRRGAANMMLRVLHIVFKWAGKRRAGLIDPTIGLEEYEGGEHEPWPEHVLAAALASEDDVFRLAVAAHLYTGQRTGDTCAMTWNAVTAEGLIRVVQQKTGTKLDIPMHPELSRELGVARKIALTMLANRKGQALTPEAFRRWVQSFGKAAGVHLVSHGLRKNAVIMLLEAGCSTAEVSSITGQSLKMVEHYAKQRNQPRIATAAMLKWGSAQTGNGKTFGNLENGGAK